MNLRTSASLRSLALVTAPFALLAMGVVSGLLDPLSDDGHVNRREAAGSIAVYWVLSCLLLWFGRTWRSRRKAWLAGLAAALLGVLVVEVGLRIVDPTLAWMRFTGVLSSRYHHLYPPNARMYDEDASRRHGVRVFIETNEDGLRSRYSREEFLRHETRVVALGDSFTFGQGVSAEATYCSRLESALRERSSARDAAVLNAGLISYSPLLARELFAGILVHYRPGLVLYMLDVTDIGDDYKYEGELERGILGFPWRDRRRSYHGAICELLRRSELSVPLIRTWVYPFEAVGVLFGHVRAREEKYDYYKFEATVDGRPERNRYFIYRHPLEKTRPYFERTLRNLKALSAAIRASSARLVVFVAPRYHHWSKDECPENWETVELERYSTEDPFQFEYFRFFEEVAGGVDFPIVSLLPEFQRSASTPLVFRMDPHWNERGHELVAEILADYLVGNGHVR